MRSVTVILRRVESPYSPQLAALLEEHLVVALVKQARLQRVLGDEDHGWSADLRENRLQLAPGAVYPIDVLGTESHANGTFLWAWANPSFSESQRASALKLRKVGRDRRIRELVEDGEVPAAEMEASLACLLGVGAVGADGYFVAEREEADVAFLLHDERLRTEPYHVLDLAFAMHRVIGAPVGHRRAVEAFAAAPFDGFTAEVGDPTIVFSHRDGHVEMDFDELGRLTDLRVEAQPPEGAGGPVAPIPIAYEAGPPAAGDPEPEDTETVAVLVHAGGPIVVCDPFHVYAAATPPPLPGGLPAGEHDVDVALVDDPAGGRRIELAYVFVSDGEVAEWHDAAVVPTDSGLVCFGTPEAVRGLADEARLLRLEAALREHAQDTWTYAKLDGVVVVSAGVGAGECVLSWGYDGDEELVCLVAELILDGDLEPAEPGAPAAAGAPGRGLQRATMAPVFVAEPDPRNVIVVTPAAAWRLAIVIRRFVEQAFGGEIDLEVVPEYEGDSPVPVRIVLDGGRSGREVIEVER